MFKKVSVLVLAVVFALSLAGCASMSTVKEKDKEIQGLKNQVSLLENQVQSKDQEIASLKESTARLSEQPKVEAGQATQEKSGLKKSKKFPNIKDVQTALKNAGLYDGNVDGRMGKQTRKAIKEFQKAHNLKINGKVNKKTWEQLSAYLNQQAQAPK